MPSADVRGREALEAALTVAGDAEVPSIVETANGTIAQALAATGRGTAVVSDDPRFDLHPLAVEHGDGTLSIQLVVAWDERGAAGPSMARFAQRLRAWVLSRYPDLPVSAAGATAERPAS